MIVLWVPLPLYLIDKCCTDPLHISNKAEDGYERAMRDVLKGDGLLDSEHVRDATPQKSLDLQPHGASGAP